jgi:hypothetical protein
MKIPYIEKDCVIEHAGCKFESGGCVVTTDKIVAYLGKEGKLTTWSGQIIGTYKITSTWKTPRSAYSSTRNQVYALVDGIGYQGQSDGIGMVFMGKRVK